MGVVYHPRHLYQNIMCLERFVGWGRGLLLKGWRPGGGAEQADKI